ncbi:hypothetical protein DMENIID0001_087680 [Sergentomyia squamirostris]
MKVIPSFPPLALGNLYRLLQVLVATCPNREYRNAIIYTGSSCRDVVLNFASTSLGDNLAWVVKNVDLMKPNTATQNTVRSSTINFLFLENLEDLSPARMIKRKASHTVVIPCNETKPHNASTVKHILKSLKGYAVTNVALILWHTSIEIWTTNHFHEMYNILVFSSQHTTDFSVPRNIQERIFFSKTKYLYRRDLYVFGYNKPPKMIEIPEEFRKFYYGIEFGGRDGFLAHHIASRLNAKLNFSLAERFNSTGNSTSRGVQFIDNLNNDVYKLRRKPDLIVMSSYSAVNSTDYELLQPHEIDCVAIVIPSIGKPLLIGIREVISVPIIKVSPIVLIIVMVVWYLINYVNQPLRRDETRVILDTLGIYLKTKCLRKVNSASEKLLLIPLFIFSLIMGALFTEFIYKNLVNPPFSPNIETLEELANSDITIWAEKYVITLLEQNGDGMDGRVKQKIVPMDRAVIIKAILAKNVSQGYALLHSTIEMQLKRKEMWTYGINAFHELSECLIPMQVSFKIIEHSLLRQTINDLLLNFLQLGFFQAYRRLESDLLYRMNISSEIPEPPYEHVAFTLDMSYFGDIFLFLLLGFLISFLTFIAELCCNYVQRQKTRRNND